MVVGFEGENFEQFGVNFRTLVHFGSRDRKIGVVARRHSGKFRRIGKRRTEFVIIKTAGTEGGGGSFE